ncbi:E3 ubiquitin/ISG15 ligase TRIM25 [Nothoprocta perdicaria]|uniref:E3 ubiquitin/ISG15 ligase TRIM25 n=1 Tax=Nothoprocta perdicaria TaxID=30464 RepID=UPI000E1BCA51|nr:E3 ubiquitin/ISG15 ligase TRIM25 [Nothoprocta perdicaria]
MASLTPAGSEPSLEDELTCSICLCLFSSPVTVPCGHNFCGSCLELTWAGAERDLSCPQCRTTFATRPQLRKNTVLCRVVQELQGGLAKAEDAAKTEACEAATTVPCDSCLQALAAKTCLTCMASFCLEHLRPHHESPAFRDHQLCPPLPDLQQRKCASHNKLMELFCREHAACICSTCILSHRLCHTSPLQQAKEEAELALKKRLMQIYNQSGRAAQALGLVKANQSKITETASRKRDLITTEFSEIKALIGEEENRLLKIIGDEEIRVCNKFDYILGVLRSKNNEIQSIRDQIETALTERDDILFLKRAAALQQVTTKDVFTPTIEMDQNILHSAYQSAINIKETVKLLVTQSKEKSAEAKTSVRPKPPGAAFPNRNIHVKKPVGPQEAIQKEKIQNQTQATPQEEADTKDKDKKKPAKSAQKPGAPNAASAAAAATKQLIDSFLKKPREELLQYADNITLDYNTAHKQVILSEKYTKISVSEIPLNYSEHPQRFTYCSQVLGFQCFKRGIHYWEVDLQQNNFCGIGICYGSMERQGPESRLGRNGSSWCIEWFNNKISAWHDDVEKCLPNTKATRIGVLLHCDQGFVIFLAVGEKHNLIYKYKAQFTEALYPAFWVFSSGTVLSLCQLKP